jgi:flagellar biogenesis protein FliO
MSKNKTWSRVGNSTLTGNSWRFMSCVKPLIKWGVACAAGAVVVTVLITSSVQQVPQRSGIAPENSSHFQFATKDTANKAGQDSYSFGASLARSLGGLFICLGIFGAGVQIFRRYGLKQEMSSKSRLTLIERLHISPKSTLHLIALDGKEFIVATGSDKPQLVLHAKDSREQFDDSLVASVNSEAERYSQMMTTDAAETLHV